MLSRIHIDRMAWTNASWLGQIFLCMGEVVFLLLLPLVSLPMLLLLLLHAAISSVAPGYVIIDCGCVVYSQHSCCGASFVLFLCRCCTVSSTQVMFTMSSYVTYKYYR